MLKYIFNISICSSTGSSKVVICNIHVLYNPRRGEIKIGQVFMVFGAAYTDFSLLCDSLIIKLFVLLCVLILIVIDWCKHRAVRQE